MDLFSSEIFDSESSFEKIILPLPDATVVYYPKFLPQNESIKLFQKLLKDTPWQQDDIKIFGKTYAQPRLTALYGENGKPYSYSGITMQPYTFSDDLLELKSKIEKVSEVEKKFTTVLLNLYRDGNDSNGWHSDDEKELGIQPVIASVSLGAKRCFQLKHKRDKKINYKLFLDPGSLLLMLGDTQTNYKHQLPKNKKINDPRINLTYRMII